NDIDKQNKLKDIEGYRYFFYNGIKPPVLFIIIIFIGIPLSIFLQYFYFPSLDERITPFLIGFPLYLISLFLYNKKIKNIIQNCETITKDALSEHILVKDKKKSQEIPLSLKIKSSLPDMNIFHIIIFLIIASPFLYFVFAILVM
ncbi:MAG: hypothetical protein GY932_07805, partial [Arcobacter sp.]|nr:hypothetical protein [Arcobacter sp.]